MTIKWKDPEGTADWKDKEELLEWAKKADKGYCTSVGDIVHETKDYIIICADKNTNGDVGSCTLIYKSLIIK